jgi:hypothetical protein
MDGVFQRGNKIQLDNVVVQNHKIEVKGHNYFVQSYVSIENTGDSYNLKPLADNLQLTHLSNSAWGARFKTALQEDLNRGTDIALAMQSARKAADAGRVEPGTDAFANLKRVITGTNNWDHVNAGVAGAPTTGGAWLKQRSRLYHLDGQYDFGNKIKFVSLLVGADARVYEVIPDGNNFVDFSRPLADRNKPVEVGGKVPDSSDFGDNVYYKQVGAFLQATKTFFDEKLKLFSSLRVDYNPEFAAKVNPRVALVYTAAKRHNFRASYQNGFRFPALFEALSFVNNGNVRRVGGLSYINEGLGYLDNSYTLVSVNTFNAAVNRDVTAGTTTADAVTRNKALLEVTALAASRPERINSFEVGYKSVLLDNKLLVDLDVYTNSYSGFLGQVEVAVPVIGRIGTDASAADMLAANRSRQVRYRVYTNAKNSYRNYGSSLGVNYTFYRQFTVGGNLNYNAISANKTGDVFVTAFNTPNWVANISLSNREVLNNAGFSVVWRWQDAFLWESPLAIGRVPAYQTLDAQVTYRMPQWRSTIKIGGANVLNNRYIQYAAGPTIGALYYVTLTVDQLLR